VTIGPFGWMLELDGPIGGHDDGHGTFAAREDQMTHPNEDLVRQANAAFVTGELGALQSQYLAENVVWHISGRGPLAGDYDGVAQVMSLLSKISELSGRTARFQLHDVVANDNHTVSLATVSAQRAGKHYHDNLVHVMHVQDGKATEVWTHAADPFAAAEFWS
jgi:ketosteroid isomerase-like protein